MHGNDMTTITDQKRVQRLDLIVQCTITLDLKRPFKFVIRYHFSESSYFIDGHCLATSGEKWYF